MRCTNTSLRLFTSRSLAKNIKLQYHAQRKSSKVHKFILHSAFISVFFKKNYNGVMKGITCFLV